MGQPRAEDGRVEEASLFLGGDRERDLPFAFLASLLSVLSGVFLGVSSSESSSDRRS